MSIAEPEADSLPRKHRWRRYCLLTLLLFVLIGVILCGWFAIRMKRAERQKEAMRAIQVLGMGVKYDYESDLHSGAYYYPISGAELPGPLWLRALLGDDFFRTVILRQLRQHQVHKR